MHTRCTRVCQAALRRTSTWAGSTASSALNTSPQLPAEFAHHEVAGAGVDRGRAVIRGNVDVHPPGLYILHEHGKGETICGCDRASNKHAVGTTTARRILGVEQTKQIPSIDAGSAEMKVRANNVLDVRDNHPMRELLTAPTELEDSLSLRPCIPRRHHVIAAQV